MPMGSFVISAALLTCCRRCSPSSTIAISTSSPNSAGVNHYGDLACEVHKRLVQRIEEGTLGVSGQHQVSEWYCAKIK